MRVLNPHPNVSAVTEMQNLFAAAFPEIGTPPIRTAWAGMIDTMPDVVPVVDRVPALSGLVIATGMSGHGFGIGLHLAALSRIWSPEDPRQTICPASALAVSLMAPPLSLGQVFDFVLLSRPKKQIGFRGPRKFA